MCIRLAQAIGYAQESITEAFGKIDDIISQEELNIKNHIRDLIHTHEKKERMYKFVREAKKEAKEKSQKLIDDESGN